MASVAVTNTFQNGASIIASQFNTNFSDLVNYINNRNSGSSAWEALSTSGNLSVTGTSALTGAVTMSGALTVTGSLSTVAQHLLATGSAATPSLAFTSDTDTGLHGNGGNILSFVTGGTDRWVVTSAGDFGPANATELLLVSDGTVTSPGIQFTNDANNGAYRIGSDHWALSAGGTKVIDLTATVVTVPVTLTLSSALAATSGGTGVAGKIISTGTYTGDGASSHDVAHGLGGTPDFVIISITGSGSNVGNFFITGMSANSHDLNGTNQTNAIKAVDGTNITLGSNAAVNSNGVSYAFIAIKAQ